ncbi:MAG: hypothetical protein ACRD82_18505 [Blastocatellia bacterium]
MPYLVRKITRAKWDSGDEFALDEIPADAVTADLRTTGNSLSFWKLEEPSDDEQIHLIALALAAGAERIDRMDLAWVEENDFHDHGISMNPSEGRTRIVSLRKFHVDAIKLDLARLCIVASSISEALSRNQHQRFTKKEITQILVEAARTGLLSLNDLAPKVREDIEKKLGNASSPK